MRSVAGAGEGSHAHWLRVERICWRAPARMTKLERGTRGVGNERNLVHLVEKSVEIKLKS